MKKLVLLILLGLVVAGGLWVYDVIYNDPARKLMRFVEHRQEPTPAIGAKFVELRTDLLAKERSCKPEEKSLYRSALAVCDLGIAAFKEGQVFGQRLEDNASKNWQDQLSVAAPTKEEVKGSEGLKSLNEGGNPGRGAGGDGSIVQLATHADGIQAGQENQKFFAEAIGNQFKQRLIYYEREGNKAIARFRAEMHKAGRDPIPYLEDWMSDHGY